MSIFKNAIDAISCGIEDYQMVGDARIKSAIRNIHTGILLLFKAKLFEIDKVLIYKKIIPSLDKGKIKWHGDTISVNEIEVRFKSLKIQAKWNEYKELNKIRNNAEHYFIKDGSKAAKAIFAKAFLIVTDFLQRELKQDPMSVFGKNKWKVLIDISEIFEEEKDKCKKSMRDFKCHSVLVNASVDTSQCPRCDGELIEWKKTENEACCRLCGLQLEKNDFIIHIILSELEAFRYEMYDSSLFTCLQCKNESIVVDEGMICAICGVEHALCELCGKLKRNEEVLAENGWCSECDAKYTLCSTCGNTIISSDFGDSGYCDLCDHEAEEIYFESQLDDHEAQVIAQEEQMLDEYEMQNTDEE